MRITYKFHTSEQRDQFIQRIYDSGAYVRRDGDYSHGFKNLCFYNGFYEVELDISYIKNASIVKMSADLCNGILENQ